MGYSFPVLISWMSCANEATDFTPLNAGHGDLSWFKFLDFLVVM